MPKLSFQYVRQREPESLLEFLSRRFRYHAPETWKDLVEKGLVRVNGRRVSPGYLLETRHKIVYERPPFPEPAVDAGYRVLYEDEHLIAVDKPANIPTSPSGKYWNHTLIHLLQRERNDPSLRAVHRLDRETSGVNLFARGKSIARALGLLFRDGLVEKTYSAVLRGHPEFRSAYVSAPLRDDEHGAVRIRQVVHPLGRPARTRFTLRALLPGAALVDAQLLTGRTHQIRAHAHWIGHPVVGDKLYGASAADFLESVGQAERVRSGRHLLHATQLRLRHPVSGQWLTIHSPPALLIDRCFQEPEH